MELLARRYRLRDLSEGDGAVSVRPAWDELNQEEVGLVVFDDPDPTARWLIARELRLRRAVSHPRLAALSELTEDGRHLLFTTPAATGLLAHLWGGPTRPALDDALHERVHQAFGELAVGLSALHAAGLTARSLAPDEVRVGPDGAVRLLGLGLGRADRTDWAAFGALLHHALAGDPAAPLDPEGSALARLAADLLAPGPVERPSPAGIARLLGVTLVEPPPNPGRARELQAILAGIALGDVVAVTGPPGTGRAALVREALRALPTWTVLRSRCFAAELTPYAALAPLVDGLTRRTASRPELAARALREVPHGSAIAKAFPDVLRAPWARPWSEVPEACTRRQLVEGLRAWLGLLADAGPLAVWVDDLQWADADSASLLSELASGRRFRLILCCRAADAPLPAAVERVTVDAPLTRVSLAEVSLWPAEPLPDDAALLAQLLASAGRPLPIDALLDAARQRRPQLSDAALRAVEAVGLAQLDEGRACCAPDREAPAPEAPLDAVTAVEAAQAAVTVSAWELAARLYGRAASLDPAHALDRQALEARALSAAGEGARAAALYTHLAARLPGAAGDEARRQAVRQLLRTGGYERAFELLPALTASVGLRWPVSRWTAYAELGWGRLGFPPSPAGVASAAAVDLARELAMSIGSADLPRAGVFAARAARLARQLGDPERVAICTAMQASNAALLGDLVTSDARLAELQPASDRLVRAHLQLHRGIIADVRARSGEAFALLSSAEQAFLALDSPLELGVTRSFLLAALIHQGRLAEFAARRAALVEEARVLGDRHGERLYRTVYVVRPELITGDVAAAQRNLERAAICLEDEERGSHWLHLELARAQVEQYTGRRAEAAARVEAAVASVPREVLWLRPSVTYTELVRLSVAETAADAAAVANRLGRTSEPLGQLVGRAARACAVTLSGRRAAAIAAWDEAEAWMQTIDMPWWHVLVQWARAQVAGDEDGRARAGDTLARMGVRDPDTFVRHFLPLTDR